MSRIRYFVAQCLFFCSILLFLIGCHANDQSSIADATNISVTPTSESTKTATLLPSVAATSSSDEIVSFPTLSAAEEQSFVWALTESDEDCLLPCFWQVTAGETKWQNIQPLLATFAHSISYRNVDGTFTDGPVGNSFVAWVYVWLPEIADAPFSYAFNVQDNMISMIEAHILPVPNVTLPAVLDIYGRPDEVWILTSSTSMDDFLEFRLTLFYKAQSFMLTYSAEAEIIDGLVRGCFSSEDNALRLVTWVSKEDVMFSELVNGVHEPRPVNYDIALEEATTMDVDAFYDAFKNTKGATCLETPTNLWPGP